MVLETNELSRDCLIEMLSVLLLWMCLVENASVMHELDCTIIGVMKRFDPANAYHVAVDMEVTQNGAI